MSSTNATVGQPQTQSKPQPTFDFTKRKRWADLLLTELVDNIVFVLSTQGKILYCGHAVTELLGWKEIELLDIYFLELVDGIDQARFRVTFNESLETGTEFNILIRLASRMSSTAQPKYVLFDMKCYPHVVNTGGEMETKCFFAMATPYPSRNTAILDSILDLKAENYRLQHLVAEHRARLPPDFDSKRQPQATSSSPSSSFRMQKSGSIPAGGSHRLGGGGPPMGAYLSMSDAHRADGSGGTPKYVQLQNVLRESGSACTDELGEEGSKKKKAKRTQFSEQYVCVRCGQTESPEWRKGPAGPKTLCNACGLRWAKQVRKVDEKTASGEGVVGSSGSGNGDGKGRDA